MQETDDIGDPIPQAPTCGALSHADYCALSDALERAEYIERVPALQELKFHNITHPLLARFRRAALDRQYALAPKAESADPDATCGAYRLVQEQRETGGLRRAAELEARLFKAHRDYLLTMRSNEKEHVREKRASNKRALHRWSARLAM
jgi:hypothetical protein